MANLTIESNKNFSTEVTVHESDRYSESVFVKIERNDSIEGLRGCHELFLTPDELMSLGKFLIGQAEEICAAQKIRKNS